MATEQQVRETKRKHAATLLQQPGVSGVGVEKDQDGEFFLSIHLDAGQPGAGAGIPDTLDGCPVRKSSSGPFRKR